MTSWNLYRPGYTFSGQDPYERAERTAAFLELSGPLYVDISAKVVKISELGAILKFPDEPKGLFYSWRHFSLCSEHMLRESRPGQRLDVKIRVDDASAHLT